MHEIEQNPYGPAGSGTDAPDVLTLVRRACAKAPDLAAIRFEDGVELSRAELLRGIAEFGGYLRDRVQPGDRVAAMMTNRAEFWIVWLATVANGASLVTLNPVAGVDDAGHVLRDSGATVVVVDAGCRSLAEELRPSCPEFQEIVELLPAEPRGLEGFVSPNGDLDLVEVRVEPDAITNVYYTSGTTGPPKGCMLAHDYWIRFVDLYRRLYGMSSDDRMLCCLQFFYGDSPWQFLTSLEAGTTLIAMRRFSVSRFWPLVRRERVTQIFGLASIPTLLLRAPADPQDRNHDVRFALQVGVPTALHQQLEERWGFPWLEAYGLTETGLVVSMLPDVGAHMTGSGSIGLPCPEVTVRVIDDDGDDVADGQPGELVVRAPGMFRAYLARPAESAETLRDGWLRTGDLATRDERGFLYFRGRSKDIIRRSGENVSAAEVEAVLRSHHLVLEVAVVPVPDELRGEEIKAYLLLVDGYDEKDLPPEEVIALCVERLAPHKTPRYLEYRHEPFPVTPSMRVRKQDLLTERGDLTVGAWDREGQAQEEGR